MSSSIFGAEQRISEPLSALAVLTGRHREIKHPRPCFSQKSTSQRNQRVNDRARGLLQITVTRRIHFLIQETAALPVFTKLPEDVTHESLSAYGRWRASHNTS